MKLVLFRLILSLIITGLFFWSIIPVQAFECGINIDPANKDAGGKPGGYPTEASLGNTGWVRIEYKDCTTEEDSHSSIAIFDQVLSNYSNKKKLVILDYYTYPNAAENIEAFAKRVETINAQLGGKIDAYEIWNEPDQSGTFIPADKFATIADAALGKLQGKTTVLGGFSSGSIDYFNQVNSKLTNSYSAVGIHPYGQKVNGVGFFGDDNSMRGLVGQYKVASGGKPIWITEIGTDVPSIAASYLTNIFSNGDDIGADKIFWFAWSDAMVNPFGLTDASQKPKDTYNPYFSLCGGTIPSEIKMIEPAISPPGDSCGGGSSTKPAEYYLYPIKGILSNSPDLFKKDLIAQGYEARCTTPKINILGKVNGIDQLDALIKSQLNININLESEQYYNYTTSEIPILRDRGIPTLFSSIEDYWGYKDTYEKEPAQQELNSAPIYSLLSLNQQCEQQKKILTTIENMCKTLQDPSTCALNQQIPNSTMTIFDLIAALKTWNPSCDTITSPDLTDAKQKEIALALANTPLYLDKAYRLAFLVVAAELKEPNIPSFDFNFLSRKEEGGAGLLTKHDVRVIAFKIPDVTTNRDFNNKELYYDDPLQLTRNSLLPTIAIDKIKEDAQKLKDLDQLPGAPSTPLIQCDGQPTCSTGTLTKTLVDFANNRVQNPGECQTNPQDLPFEEVKQIKDSGQLNEENPGVLHNVPPESGNTVTKLIEQGIKQTDLAFKFLTSFTLKQDSKAGVDSQIISMLIVPQGYELAEVEKALASLIYTDAEIKEMTVAESYEDLPYDPFFKLTNTGQEFPEAKTGEITVGYDSECLAKIPPGLSPENQQAFQEECARKIQATIRSIDDKGTLDTSQTDREPRISGGYLGFLMRKIQESLNTISSSTHQWLTTVKTTEEYLLGLKGDQAAHQTPAVCLKTCEDKFAAKELDETEYLACKEQCESATDKYCIAWTKKELDRDGVSITAIGEKVRTYLKSSEKSQYTHPQDPDRLDAVRAGNFVKWDGSSMNPIADKTNWYEWFYGGGRALLWTRHSECNGQACFDFIIDKCTTAGFNPGLCVAMNFSETGGSNHIRFPNSADFGCMAGNYPNVRDNLDCLINDFFKNYETLDYNGMWQKFAGLGFESSSYGKVREYYKELTSGMGYTDGECKK